MDTKYGYYDPDGDLDWFPPYTPVDIKDPPSWEDTAPSEYEPPHFVNPLDSMPIATDKLKENEEEITMHEKMYRLATKNGTTITMGGSENLTQS